MQPFYGVKLSDSPLTEWHAFATIPDTDDAGSINGFSVVVSNAGDWTRRPDTVSEMSASSGSAVPRCTVCSTPPACLSRSLSWRLGPALGRACPDVRQLHADPGSLEH